MSFHVGQKVVCVDDTPNPRWPVFVVVVPPQKGSVYTVRATDPDIGKFGCLLLDEIHNPIGIDGFDVVWFSAHRFRPLKTTSIEIFRAMLVTPPKETVEA